MASQDAAHSVSLFVSSVKGHSVKGKASGSTAPTKQVGSRSPFVNEERQSVTGDRDDMPMLGEVPQRR